MTLVTYLKELASVRFYTFPIMEILCICNEKGWVNINNIYLKYALIFNKLNLLLAIRQVENI